MFKPRYIVWHTAADPRDNGNRDTTAAEIRTWHLARGWSDIGYHFVIRKNGTIEKGRNESLPGNHVRGLNNQSLGICFSGHGDLQPLTPEQIESGIKLTISLMKKYDIPVSNVIGHREINDLIKAGKVSKIYQTTKSCPGTKVQMNIIRAKIMKELFKSESGGQKRT
jgi:N-acetyl-anhydromuramyl-L-alanine amidase AmpD